MYLHPSVDPSRTHFVGEFPGLRLALVLDVVVPEAEYVLNEQIFRYVCPTALQQKLFCNEASY